jgi:adhesin/invasin
MKPPATVLLATALICAPLLADQALFRNASISYGGGAVLDMKAADVNHDGKQDVILLQKAEGKVDCRLITLFGNGDGTFRDPVKTPVTAQGSIAAGDLDGDGNVDVVLSGSDQIFIEVYRGNSDGSFTLRSTKKPANIYTGGNLILTDLNGDGKLDLISQYGRIITFRGNGDGTFADGVMQPGPYNNGWFDIVAGDFNGDGKTDVLASTSYDGQIVWSGNGDGSFNAPTYVSIDGSMVAPGDFNGDGKLDYLSIDPANGWAFVHISKGNGTFIAGANYLTGVNSRVFAIDFDGDGKLDVVAAGKELVTVMRSNGDGTFALNHYVAKATALVIADFDGDHHLDLLTGANTELYRFNGGYLQNSYADPVLNLLHGNGDGTLAAYRKSFLGRNATGSGSHQSSVRGIAVADFNGDRKPDVVSRNDGIIVMLNRGDGGFGSPLPLEVPPGVEAPLGFATGDVNRDGKADIVVVGSHVWTYLGNGDGTFHSAAPGVLLPYYFYGYYNRLTLKDMNGDGTLDAIIFSPAPYGSGEARLLLGNGDGTFAGPILLPRVPDQIADFDGDGLPDFASNTNSYGYTFLHNNGNGTFTAGTTVRDRSAIAVGDFNNDGKPDLIDGRMRLGKGDGTFTDLPLQFPSGSSLAQTVTADFDGDGNLDLAFQNEVMLGNGDGTFRALIPCVLTDPWPELAAADIDGNGSDDLLLLDSTNAAVNVLLTRRTALGTTPLSFTETTSLSTLHPGETVTVTIRASTSSTFVPLGTVRIDADGAFAGFATLKDGIGSLTWAPQSVGEHTITASYVGDDVFAAGSTAVTRTAVKLDSKLNLSRDPASPQVQQLTTLFPSVSPQQPSTTSPTGTITVREGDTVLHAGPYDSSRLFTYGFPTPGTHTLTIDYSGDANYTAASTTVALSVTKAVATVKLTTSPSSPLKAGQSLTLQAAVTASISLDGGTVTFRDFGAAIRTVPLAGGSASITIEPAAGFHSYSATYDGNAGLDPASSSFNDYVVNTVPCTPAANCSRRRAVH